MESALKLVSKWPAPSHDDKEQVLQYLEAAVACHQRLIESTGNHWVQRFYHSIHSSLTRYEFIYTYLAGHPYQRKNEHFEILALIRRGNYEKAKKSLTSHIYAVADVLEKKLTQESATRASPKGPRPGMRHVPWSKEEKPGLRSG
jgi:DNA-binding GntR family transcriptional regulator